MQTQETYNRTNGEDTLGYVGDTALPAGLSLILADAARSHLKAGDVKTASRCLEEAERLMSFLPGVNLPETAD